mgnify:CR=1 FL=1
MTTVNTETVEPMTDRERELIELLREARSLGLTFHIGSAYISRAYIDHQEDLKAGK